MHTLGYGRKGDPNEPGYGAIYVGKTENPYCPRGNTTTQTGARITFDCPVHQRERTALLGGKNNWEEVDTSNEIRVDVNEYEGGVMLFFAHPFDYLT